MLQAPLLDDKTFAQLVEDARKQIPRYAPDWTDFNLHDPGITILEMLAWLTEGQRYYMDQIRGGHLLKYVKLLGASPRHQTPARTEVTLTFRQPNDDIQPVFIPAGTPFEAGDIRFETAEPLMVTPVSIRKIITLARSAIVDQTEANGYEGLTYMAFGEEADQGGALYIGFDRPFPEGESIPVTFKLYDGYPVTAGRPDSGEAVDVTPSARLRWEYLSLQGWKPLMVERDETVMLTFSGRITFQAPGDADRTVLFPVVAEPCCWFRCLVEEGGYELPPRLDSIMLHTVTAVQLDTRLEYLGHSNGLGWQTFELSAMTPVLDSVLLEVDESGEGEWTVWTLKEDWDASGPSDRHYVIDLDEGAVSFGDGIRGMVPPKGGDQPNIRISYAATLGEAGNVPAGTIRGFVNEPGWNEQLHIGQFAAAIGGMRAEQAEEALLRAGQELQACTRAVTDEDYERLACATPGIRVARAKAIASGPNRVTVVVLPYSSRPNPQPSAGFMDTVYRHLDRYRLITTSLTVLQPQYVKVKVYVLITLMNGHNGEIVRNAVKKALSGFLHPLQGGVDGNGWPFGRTVYISDLYARIDRIEGVEHVQRLQLLNTGGAGRLDEQGNLWIDGNGLVYSDEHQVEAELPQTVCQQMGGG